MKIAFSSLVCPTWDFETIVAKAKTMGFDGLELRGVAGELELPLVPTLAGDPQQVRQRLQDNQLDLVCLGASATLDSLDPREVARQRGVILEYVELAARLGCPAVRIFAGEVQGRRDNPRLALARVGEALRSLTPVLARHQVTLLVENGADFPRSDDLWFLMDVVGHPRVRCRWNQCTARAVGERATTSIPRLGTKIGLVHICDAQFDSRNALVEYRLPGKGDVEVAREIELLRGTVYRGYLSFEWPKLWVPSLPEPDAVLPEITAYLRARLAEQQPVLSAYKGDKNAPRFASTGGKPKAAASSP
jgi:fatty-acyl-CoA synthase